MYSSIRPGQVWLDTNGKRIQAHGGSIFYEEATKTFYFYGENKEYTIQGNNVWTWGVRAYASKDFYNWEDKGLIIAPELEDETSSLNPYNALLDRPHIIYNRFTRKYVCWCKVVQFDGTQTEVVLTADAFLGPYTIVIDHLRPLNMSAGDFDLAVAEDGKAYYMFERVHSETIIADLTEDYINVTGYYSTHFPHPHPPFVREGTAHFMHNHKHYLITSGTTGYLPNPSQVAIADTWHGPYQVLGNLCPKDESDTTYHCQISSVFKMPGKKNLYIAIGDRWCPDSMDLPYGFYAKYYEERFSGRLKPEDAESFMKKLLFEYQLSEEAIAKVDDLKRDTSVSDYIWLPLHFEEPDEKHPYGMVSMDWLDEWKWENYD